MFPVALFSCVGCDDSDLGIKIYVSRTDKGGLFRDQNNQEVIPYEKSDGYFCTDEAGMRRLVEAYRMCFDQ